MTVSTITINTVDYDAYASVAEADAYLAVDPVRGTTWAALTDDQKGANLVAASRTLDLLDWPGTKTSDAQPLEWPRDDVNVEGVTDGTLPVKIETAAILLAGSIAIKAATAEGGGNGSNLKSVKAGSVEVEFFRPTTGVALKDETVYSLIKKILAAGSASVGTGLACGTDETTSFGDKYGLTQGYS